MPEFYRWIIGGKICNYKLDITKCASILNVKNVKNIVFFSNQEFDLNFIKNLSQYEIENKQNYTILTKK